MALPRGRYVREGQEGVYHCFSRCVRRAFLCGVDAVTGQDFTHRKVWLVERLRHLAALFAVEVCAYAVMDNHYHTILRTRPDIVAGWSDREVATRWLTLFPHHRDLKGSPVSPPENEIRALTDRPERIATLRRRLSSLSWFMGRLNEFIARAANKEDTAKGRFWESRFKCQALLDEPAIAACMVYVDLNPIRVGRADSPEESNFTSIQERIRAWQNAAMTTASAPGEATQHIQGGSLGMDTRMPGNAGPISSPVSAPSNRVDGAALSAGWLCPLESDSHRRGILQITAAEYFDLVDKSGRMTRSDKPGAIDVDLAPILLRIGANTEAWPDTVSCFGSRFHLAAGLLSSLRRFADQVGSRWLKGVVSARAAFAPTSPHWA
jgi:hypothetical protein